MNDVQENIRNYIYNKEEIRKILATKLDSDNVENERFIKIFEIIKSHNLKHLLDRDGETDLLKTWESLDALGILHANLIGFEAFILDMLNKYINSFPRFVVGDSGVDSSHIDEEHVKLYGVYLPVIAIYLLM